MEKYQYQTFARHTKSLQVCIKATRRNAHDTNSYRHCLFDSLLAFSQLSPGHLSFAAAPSAAPLFPV